MKQPDIGQKVAELRQQMNITQEQLAEHCQVSTRTIQRIESGEVEPRAFTRSNLSDALGFDFGQDNTENERLWLALIHLSSIAPMIVFPLLLWSWKKNQSYQVDHQGRLAINFQITMAVLLLFAMLCSVFFIPAMLLLGGTQFGNPYQMPNVAYLPLASLAPLPMIVIGLFCFAMGIINTLRALSERRVRYPFSIRFVR